MSLKVFKSRGFALEDLKDSNCSLAKEFVKGKIDLLIYLEEYKKCLAERGEKLKHIRTLQKRFLCSK